MRDFPIDLSLEKETFCVLCSERGMNKKAPEFCCTTYSFLRGLFATKMYCAEFMLSCRVVELSSCRVLCAHHVRFVKCLCKKGSGFCALINHTVIVTDFPSPVKKNGTPAHTVPYCASISRILSRTAAACSYSMRSAKSLICCLRAAITFLRSFALKRFALFTRTSASI